MKVYGEYKGGRGWYGIWKIVSSEPELLSLRFKQVFENKPYYFLIDVDFPETLLPLLHQGVQFAITNCHLAKIKAGGVWKIKGDWWFTLPAVVADGSRRHEWTWHITKHKVYFICQDCRNLHHKTQSP